MKLPQNLLITDPVSYFEMLLLLKSCTKVITDSGGLQKEAYWMEKPCVTVREETEWVETLEGGWNQLTGPNAEKIIHALKNEPTTDWKPVYGDGKASEKIAEVIGSQS
jgi:UDP-GlcNAc3NAcA epimerase